MTAPGQPIRVFLCGDVMTGRGIDQALPHAGDPALRESHVRDARDYVRLAERAAGPIPRGREPAAIWGDALETLEAAGAEIRIVNLETSITAVGRPWPGKGIHYRMHPANVACLAAARLDCCCLANNHVLDWGYDGLAETLRALDRAGIRRAGAGEHAAAAGAPAALPLAGGGRVLVFALGSPTSGIPGEWAAGPGRPGVYLLEELTEARASREAARMAAFRRPGDRIVASIHWGENWGYAVPEEQVRFARRLVDGGADVVHGHSSHHPKGIEVYRGRLILYGCGDFLDDYEGIICRKPFLTDLRVLYLASLERRTGALVELWMLPLRMHGFRLRQAEEEDAGRLRELLDRLGVPFGTRLEPAAEGGLLLRR